MSAHIIAEIKHMYFISAKIEWSVAIKSGKFTGSINVMRIHTFSEASNKAPRIPTIAIIILLNLHFEFSSYFRPINKARENDNSP